MTHFSHWKSFPPVLSQSSNDFQLNHECHRQNVERHIKLVMKASGSVCGYSRKDGLIRNKIISHKLMKDFVSKKYFKVTH